MEAATKVSRASWFFIRVSYYTSLRIVCRSYKKWSKKRHIQEGEQQVPDQLVFTWIFTQRLRGRGGESFTS